MPLATKTHVHSPGFSCGCVPSPKKTPKTGVSTDASPQPKPILLTQAVRRKILFHHQGERIDFILPGGVGASGVVGNVIRNEAGLIGIDGTLDSPRVGRFLFAQEPEVDGVERMYGMVYFEDSEVAYRVESLANGDIQLKEVHVDEVICRNYTMPVTAPDTGSQSELLGEDQESPGDHPNVATPPYQGGVIPLSSLPGAQAVVYLDFDGEKGPFLHWGDFDAASPELPNYTIKSIWKAVAEDFSAFNINVTTDLQMYLNAPADSRIRCITTPTNEINPNVGGIATLGSFNSSREVVCWNFLYPGLASHVISHEVGHTLGLRHDGLDGSEYDRGFHETSVGRWGPIMGAPYRSHLSQWSKGEYVGSTRTEDDLAIIQGRNNVGYRVDDHGETFATASLLDIKPDDSLHAEGIIETQSDFDGFKFSLTAASSVSFDIATFGNVDALAEIVSSAGVVLASANPLNQVTATVTASLGVGDYFLRVSGVGVGSPPNDGYTDYGSIGHYTVTGSVPNAVRPDLFSIAENSPNGSFIGTVLPRNNHGADPLSYAITSGNMNGAVVIDTNSGSVTVADVTQLDHEALSSYYDDPATFEFYVSITNASNPSLNESVRVVIEVTDVQEAPVVRVPINSILHVLEHTPIGGAIYQAKAVNEDNQSSFIWSITNSSVPGLFEIDPDTGWVTVTAQLDSLVPNAYTFEVTATYIGNSALSDSVALSIEVTDIVEGYELGHVFETIYSDILVYSSLNNLTNNYKFPLYPDLLLSLDRFTQTLEDYSANLYGVAIRGYIIPPTTGEYSFWLEAGASEASLRLSTDENPDNMVVIASLAKDPSGGGLGSISRVKSDPVTLIAGQPYYMEMLHGEHYGSNYRAVYWEGPGVSEQIIRGSFLSPYQLNFPPSMLAQSNSVEIQQNVYNGHELFKVRVSDLNVEDTHGEFRILTGNGIFTIDPNTGVISMLDNSWFNVGQTYNLRVEFSDSGVPSLSGSGNVSLRMLPVDEATANLKVQQEVFEGVTGGSVSNLTAHPNYPDSPTSVKELDSFDIGENVGDAYGSRIRAYVIPPATGDYRFYLSAADSGQLYLSSDEDESHKSQIASLENRVDYGEWTKYNSQRSAEIHLIAGQKYYIEALHKEDSGDDHLQVGWTGPTFPEIEVIDRAYLRVYSIGQPPVWNAASYAFAADNTSADGTVIGSVLATTSVPGGLYYAILSGNDGGAYAINPLTGELCIANRLGMTVGDTVLSIGAQDDAPIYHESLVAVTISVSGNNAPVVTAASYTVPENSPASVAVGSVNFVDPDPETWVYSIIEGNESRSFQMNASTGALTTTGSPKLDYEVQSSFVLLVRVTDSSGYFGVGNISVNVSDIANDDSDGDGLDDFWELTHFGSTTGQTGSGDFDEDGLTNLEEAANNSNPTLSDSDSDGFSDQFEIEQGSDPNNSTSVPNTPLVALWTFDDPNPEVNITDRIARIKGYKVGESVAYTADAGGRSGGSGDYAMSFHAGVTGSAHPGMRVDDVAFFNKASAGDYLTVSYWQKLDEVKDTMAFSIQSESGIAFEAYSPYFVNGQTRVYFRAGDAGSLKRSFPGELSGWVHVTLVKRGSEIEIWVNGGRQGVGRGVPALGTDMTYLRLSGNAVDGADFMEGTIDDFAIFDSALDSTQINQLSSGADPVSITRRTLPVAEDSVFSVVENSVNGTAVGQVTASASSSLHYVITEGNEGEVFAMDSSTGEITVAGTPNYEGQASYTLTVEAIDYYGGRGIASVTINVTDVDERALGGLAAWEEAVHRGLTHTVKRTTPLAGNATTPVDLSAINGSSSYEFVVEAVDLNASMVDLLSAGDWHLRFEQSEGSGEMGITLSGTADYLLAAQPGHSVNSPYGRLVHLVVVVDFTSGKTSIYLDAVLVGTLMQTPSFTHFEATLGDVGLRDDSEAGIHAFAAYNAALSAEEIITHYRAWFGADQVVDSDSDNLDDSWELEKYGNLNSVLETSDTDGDGYSAFDEMVRGTDPMLATQVRDFFKFKMADDTGSDQLSLSFRRPLNFAQLNVVYQLESTTDFVSGWVNEPSVPASIIPDEDGLTEWVNYRIGLTNDKIFLRMKVSLAP